MICVPTRPRTGAGNVGGERRDAASEPLDPDGQHHDLGAFMPQNFRKALPVIRCVADLKPGGAAP